MVFQKAIAKAEPAEEVALRVNNLIDCITFSVYQYTSRGLFECDKLIFACQMTFQVHSAYNKNDRYSILNLKLNFLDFINERRNFNG